MESIPLETVSQTNFSFKLHVSDICCWGCKGNRCIYPSKGPLLLLLKVSKAKRLQAAKPAKALPSIPSKLLPKPHFHCTHTHTSKSTCSAASRSSTNTVLYISVNKFLFPQESKDSSSNWYRNCTYLEYQNLFWHVYNKLLSTLNFWDLHRQA